MPSILISQYPTSPLNTDVSCFKNTKDIKPRKLNLLSWLDNPHNEIVIKKLRSCSTERYPIEKKMIPAITPSGLFTERKASCLIKHSGLIQFDIDNKENAGRITNFLTLKEQICKIKNVAYCGLSASGAGFWGLIPIAYPEKHKEHFSFIEKAFASFNIIIDQACSDVSRLRIMSYDSDPYFNHNAELLTSYTKIECQDYDFKLDNNNDKEKEQRIFEAHIQLITDNRIEITGNYKDWFSIGCALANTFGSSGRKYFHAVSRFHGSYNTADTDRQFSACLTGGYNHTIGTFYHFCKKSGIQKMPYAVSWGNQYAFF